MRIHILFVAWVLSFAATASRGEAQDLSVPHLALTGVGPREVSRAEEK